jgi:RimJ/RimL family protein N-acetyltransferase
MKFHIETERLILRELQTVDLQAWYEMDSDPAVHTYLGNQPVKNISHIENAFQSIQQQYAENGIGRWAMIEKSSGNFIGWSGLKFIREQENNHINFYDVGYRLHPNYWGKGYATESCKAALEYGFKTLNLKEIIGTANVENIKSRRVLEKCGLTFVNQFMWKDIKCDWLKITKEEWGKLV